MDKRRTKRTSRKCFRYGSKDYLNAKCLRPPKLNEKWQKKARFNKEGNHTYDNKEKNSDQKIYAYMARMYGNDKCPSGSFGGS